MLRVVTVLLLVANVLYYAWQHGHLAVLGLVPRDTQREPQRLQAQVNPDWVRLLDGAPGAAPATATSAPATMTIVDEATGPALPPPAPPEAAAPTPMADASPPTACWRASGLDASQAEQLRARLVGMPELQGQWQLDEVPIGGRWVVYMGKLNPELMARKKAELRALGVEFREVRVPHLSPGLALGTYSTEAGAQQALLEAMAKGVRTARVAQEREPGVAYTLTLPALSAPQRDLVQAILGERVLTPCP